MSGAILARGVPSVVIRVIGVRSPESRSGRILLFLEKGGSDSINDWRILTPWEPSAVFFTCDTVARFSK